MLTARSFCAAAALGKSLFVCGGHAGGPAFDKVEHFDSVSGVWKELAPMPTARFDCAAAVAGGKLYVFGGAAGQNQRPLRPRQTLQAAERFDPETGQWEELQPMPTARRHLAAVVLHL